MDVATAGRGPGGNGAVKGARAESAGAGPRRGGAAAAEALRQRLREHLEDKIQAGGGHATVTTRSLAEEFGVSTATVSNHMARLAEMGVIQTRSAGRKGLIVSAGGSGRRAAARGNRSVRTGTATGRAPRTSAGTFCPWCGARTQRGWRFCNACGERLTR